MDVHRALARSVSSAALVLEHCANVWMLLHFGYSRGCLGHIARVYVLKPFEMIAVDKGSLEKEMPINLKCDLNFKGCECVCVFGESHLKSEVLRVIFS